MGDRSCAACGESIVGRRPNARYCTRAECRTARRSERYRAYSSANGDQIRARNRERFQKRDEAPCQQCGTMTRYLSSTGICRLCMKLRPDAPRCTVDGCNEPRKAYGKCALHLRKNPRGQCSNCGKPITGAGTAPADGVWFCYAPECRRLARQHEYERLKDDAVAFADMAALNVGRQRARRAALRTATPQSDPSLPPLGAMLYDAAGKPICHVCGKAFRNVGIHAKRSHEISADEYRERYELARRQALVASDTSAMLSASIQRTIDAGRLTPQPSTTRPSASGPMRLQSRIAASQAQLARSQLRSCSECGQIVLPSRGAALTCSSACGQTRARRIRALREMTAASAEIAARLHRE